MEASETKPVAIVGAGLAGLTAASLLRRSGVPFILYEAGPKIAGLATSFHDTDGFTYDFGAHFITNRLAAAIGIGSTCRTVRSYGESVRLGGRTYSYPFGLMRSVRFSLGAIGSRVVRPDAALADRSAAGWFRARYGRPMADAVAIPLLEAWSGVPATTLAPSVGWKFQNSVGKTLLLKLAGRLTGRAVTCGYSHDIPENPHVWHVYPEGGMGLLCQRLAADVGDALRLESPVERILVDSGRAVAVRVRGREQPVSAVVTTAPCHVLAKLVEGTDALGPLARFRYRAMVFVNLRLEGRGVLPDTLLWTPERSLFPFFRVTETPLSMPWLAPPDKTLLTADLGCSVDDAIWRMDDAALGELCVDTLQPIVPDVRRRYRGCRVLRTPIAYPIYLNEYEADRQRLARTTGVEGLVNVGRNAEFTHSLMEDVYWRTTRKLRKLVRTLQGVRSNATAPAVASA